MNWADFEPSDFEYDFEADELHAHRVSLNEAIECFYNDFEIRRNKSFEDRYQLIGRTDGGRKLKVIFQLKPGSIVRIYYRVGLVKKKLSEKEIDRRVVAEANDETKWEAPARVVRRGAKSTGKLRSVNGRKIPTPVRSSS